MKRNKYEIWLDALGHLMKAKGMIKHYKDLCPKSWKPYFDEGMTRQQTLDAEFGSEWRKLDFLS